MARLRAPKDQNGKYLGRHCALCGRIGGGATTPALNALREAGAKFADPDERRYAHADCIAKAKRKIGKQPAHTQPYSEGTPTMAENNADLTALLARLEEATEGGEHLDEMIFAFDRGWSYPLCGAAITDFDRSSRTNFTTSLDAALTLVPEGKGLLANVVIDTRGDVSACSVMADQGEVLGYAAHIAPALALCIAALKARLA